MMKFQEFVKNLFGLGEFGYDVKGKNGKHEESEFVR
jgi:hypothetical protein